MKHKQIIRAGYILLLVTMSLQLMHRSVLPESYPAVLMPTFSRVGPAKDEIKISKRYLLAQCASGEVISLECDSIFRMRSLNGRRTMFDMLFLNKREQDLDKGRYEYFRRVFGERAWRILKMLHHRPMDTQDMDEMRAFAMEMISNTGGCDSIVTISGVHKLSYYDPATFQIRRTSIVDSMVVLSTDQISRAR